MPADAATASLGASIARIKQAVENHWIKMKKNIKNTSVGGKR
jgi:hypothetical protein